MDFDLKELGATLVVGAYFLFGLEVISFLVLGSNVFVQVVSRSGTKFTTQTLLALSIVLCFALGMLMEDVSDKFVDRDTLTQELIMRFMPSGSTDDDIKQAVLYGENRQEAGPLAREMADRHLFCRFAGNHGLKIEEAITKGSGASLWGMPEKERESAAKRLYYHAKNVVYKESTYYDELKKIQSRIDFSRSYLVISALLLGITLALTVYKVFKLGIRLRRNPTEVEKQRQAEKLWNLSKRLAGIVSFFLFSCLLGTFAYKAEETQFDNRAYGYFSSLNAPAEKPPGHNVAAEQQTCNPALHRTANVLRTSTAR